MMVWIHGGSFAKGSTLDYGTEGIVRNFVSKGVVVVLLQYRLGLFGEAGEETWVIVLTLATKMKLPCAIYPFAD